MSLDKVSIGLVSVVTKAWGNSEQTMKISGGICEQGLVVGNLYDKYNSCNPIVRRLMQGYERALCGFVAVANPATIHEIGCGEGYWVIRWRSQGLAARGSEFSPAVVDMAIDNAADAGLSEDGFFEVRSIYDLDTERDSADLVVCCEVLEHLEKPLEGMAAIQRLDFEFLILSVPREPIWRVLNLTRGEYILDFGNTPGHLQHWSTNGFVDLAAQYFEILDIKTPLPWTMLLCKKK